MLKFLKYLILLLATQLSFTVSFAAAPNYFSEPKDAPADFILQKSNLFQVDAPAQIENLRKKYGDQFTAKVIQIWSEELFSKDSSCEKYIGTCDFYLCQEQKSPCGLEGYNLSFGFKYCSGSKFKLLNQMQTGFGKSWVTNVIQCLQKQNILKSQNNETRTCEQIKSDAFASHSDCYVESGFCELEISEKLRIFQLVKKEIFSPESFSMGLGLLRKCHMKN